MQGASFIGRAYGATLPKDAKVFDYVINTPAEPCLDFLTHKILHAGLSMASTIGSDAINSGQINWDKAFLACGVTVAAESTAEGALRLFHDQLPTPFDQESGDSYWDRCDQELKNFAEKTAASIRIMGATGLALAGKDSGDIQACDQVTANALENNFWFVIPALFATLTAVEVIDGAQHVMDEVNEGDYIQALGVAAKTGIKALPGMKLLKTAVEAGETAQALANGYQEEGVKGAGKVLAKEIFGQKVAKAVGRGLKKLEKAGKKAAQGAKAPAQNVSEGIKAPAEKVSGGEKVLAQKASKQEFKKEMNPEKPPAQRKHLPEGAGGQGGIDEKPVTVKENREIEEYFKEYKDEKFKVGLYGNKDMKDVSRDRNEWFKNLTGDVSQNSGASILHHVGTHANNRQFISFDIHRDAGVSILIPKSWHESFVHTVNTYKFNNLREALFWSVRDLRNCASRIADPVLQQEVRKDLNKSLLEVIRLNKEYFSEYLQKNVTK
ncbi:hypothetical protein HE1_00025 [Holospora elegans E1]|uniref:Uncharacterized protein n=1 Tax=Holospora elegans E1 TaxID=1427503 RepID=A0A023DWN3_9PROT|nr:hypothetical protein HE1_00025 [Holospora elegans E1]